MSKRMKFDSRNILLKMNEWRTDGLYCDATFVIDEHKFHVHKIVLSAAVDYFGTVFNSDYCEEEEKDTIELIGVDPIGFEMFLHYIYTKEMELDDDRFKRILPLVRFYQIDCLSDRLLDYVQNSISVENALDYYLLSILFRSYRIGEFAKDFVQKNFLPALKCTAFGQLTFPMLLVFVSSRQTVLPNEIDRFKAIVDWIEYDEKERSKYLPELIKYVQFTSISENVIVNVVLKNALILNCYDSVRIVIEKARTGLEKNEHSPMVAEKNPAHGHSENCEAKVRLHQPARKVVSKLLSTIHMGCKILRVIFFDGDKNLALTNIRRHIGKFGLVRVFGKKEQQLIAIDVMDSLVVRSCVMDNCDEFDQFHVVLCRNRLYVSTFHYNFGESYHIFHYFDEPLWHSTKKYYLGNSAFKSVIYLEKYNSIYGNSLRDLYCYNLFADRVSVVTRNGLPCSLTFQGSLTDYQNVIYACGSTDSGSAIYLYDPQAGKWQFRCWMETPMSYLANTIVNDRMYLLTDSGMQMYNVRSNRFSTVCNHRLPWFQAPCCSLVSCGKNGDLYVVNETGINIYYGKDSYRLRHLPLNTFKIKIERAIKLDLNSLKYLPF